MGTKAKTKMITLYAVMCFLFISAISVTIVCAVNSKVYSQDVGILYNQPASTSQLTYTLDSSTDTYSLTGASSSISGNVIIPKTYNGKAVTTIGSYAFEDCSNITSVTIQENITSIGSAIFTGCSSLSNINVASGNTTYHSAGDCIIETSSKTLIAGCKNSVIPTDGSVTSIGPYAFYGCSTLTTLTVPSSVKTIGVSAFAYCSSLTKLNLPTGLTSFDMSAYDGCTSLTTIMVPSCVASNDGYWGWWSILDSSNLTGITFEGGACEVWVHLLIEIRDDGTLEETSIPLTMSIDDAEGNLTALRNVDNGYSSVESKYIKSIIYNN